MMAQKKEKRFRRRLDESQSNGPPTKLQKTYDPTLAELFQSSVSARDQLQVRWMGELTLDLVGTFSEAIGNQSKTKIES